MNCPDCGSKIIEVPTSSRSVMRCFKCGGFWLDADTANNLTAADMVSWRRISVGTNFLSGGSGTCPADGLLLAKYTGEQVPISVNVLRCVRCGKWWFPGENLFNFKPAVDAKRMYFWLWGLPFNPTTVLLPLFLIATLLGGAFVGVTLIGQTQRPNVEATEILTEFSGSYLGMGKALIGFKSVKPVSEIDYRQVANSEWLIAKTEYLNGYYVANLENLTEGESYLIRILAEEWGFVAK